MRRQLWLALAGLAWLSPANGQQPRHAEHWIASWGTAQPLSIEATPDWVEPPPHEPNAPPPAPSPIPLYPQMLSDQTVRMIVRTSVGGRQLRITLSNALGMEAVSIGAAHVALRDRDSATVPGSDRAVTFGGQMSFTIQPGALVVSDAVDLVVPDLGELAVSLYVPQNTPHVTTHELGLKTTYVAHGNGAAAVSLPGAATNLSYFWLTGIEVSAPTSAGTIVAYGDSITDGFSSTPDAERAWPALLATKLHERPTAPWAVVNAGISGNRVRRDVVGTSALARFDRDVLARAGVRWLVLFEGINDITFSALPRAPQNQRTTANELIEALAQIVDRAHACGIEVVGATLMPMDGLWLHNVETENLRQAVNRWIRTGDRFDAVVDFDAATRDPQHPERLRADFDSGDHIHPNDAGNAAMAAAIDVSIFAR